jgi:N6-adenosine-specific RNA methylase IME4
MILPSGPFDLLYVDFPLHWQAWSSKGDGRSPQRKYRCPPMPELLDIAKALRDIAAPNSVMASWVYGPRLPDNLRLIEAAGFVYRSSGFVWLKTDAAGKPLMGCGFGTRKETECLWIASRGKGLKRRDMGVRELIQAPRQRHSTKPDEAAHRLERLYGEVRRLEMFARKHRPGWESYGDELADE